MSDEKTERLNIGALWQLFAVMDGDELSRVVAKNPRKPQVVDITEDLARHLDWVKTGGRP